MPYLAFNLNDGNEFVFDLIEEKLQMGRTDDNDIVIDNTYISAHHAEFLRQADGSYEVADLKSSNGTFVNGKRVERARLRGGDKLRFGQLAARFRERAPRGLAPDETGAKTVGGSAEARPPNGRRGGTDPVPLPDVQPPPQPRKETGRIEPATLAGVKMAGEEVAAFARQERLRRDLADLEAKRAGLSAELARAEETIAEAAKAAEELPRARDEAAAARAAAKTETDKLNAARRETSNLESRREALLREIDKAQEDVDRAKDSLRNVHEEVEQARAKAREERQEVERLRVELEKQRAEQTGTEERLRGQIAELEEKHKLLRQGLATDEATVLMFVSDLIKRLDLIDALRQRFADAQSGEVARQLLTLRAAVEDILRQHGVKEFGVPPGTEVTVDLRKRITVADSVPGTERARVAECCRTGYLRALDDGREVILRKAEVRTING